ncbi:hypothetical protein [Cucumibacter marinus]|uniref:hypothetical protein n=1 Tax=Cucumibacter marinus TaxID=1121252 RepID=UPI0003F4E1D5|nr:hypothetical protein [Cucumibacter marinus]
MKRETLENQNDPAWAAAYTDAHISAIQVGADERDAQTYAHIAADIALADRAEARREAESQSHASEPPVAAEETSAAQATASDDNHGWDKVVAERNAKRGHPAIGTDDAAQATAKGEHDEGAKATPGAAVAGWKAAAERINAGR